MTPIEVVFSKYGIRIEKCEGGWAFNINWGKFCVGVAWWPSVDLPGNARGKQ